MSEFWANQLEQVIWKKAEKETARQIAEMLRSFNRTNEATYRRVWGLSSAAVEIEEKFGLRDKK